MHAQKTRLYHDVQFLTELRPFRNYRNTAILATTCSYIRQAFKKAGLEVEEQKWKVNGVEYTNVIGVYNKGKAKRLIVGAHYDVCGDQPGADDNASAVAGLLESVRLIGEHRPKLDYRIDFVAYCLEEPPFFGTEAMGSYVHAKSLHDKKVDVMGMICFEMIGYFSDKPNSQPFPDPAMAKLFPHTANFIIVVGIQRYAAFTEKVKKRMAEKAKIDVQMIHFPDASGLAGLSDHRNYWSFGYPALMINDTSFIRNTNYHKASDTIDTLDFDKMTEVVNGAYAAIVGMG
ncbi:MAG: M28 family peptidase [Mucilaginibacter polytrichastri]|nr:M28 family peptidase [Mucilaginibacter polytrichastri]